MQKIICISLFLFLAQYVNAQCNHSPSTMPKDTVLVCVPYDTVTIKNNNNQVLLPIDALMYVLHDAPNTTLGTVIKTSMTGFFDLNGLSLDTCKLYYVSAVVGKKLPNGQVDLTDICLKVAKGTPFFRLKNKPSIIVKVTTVAQCPPIVVCGDNSPIEACPPITPTIKLPPLPTNACQLYPTKWDTVNVILYNTKDTGVWSIKEFPNALVIKDTIFIPNYKIVFGDIHNKKTTIKVISLKPTLPPMLNLSITARFRWYESLTPKDTIKVPIRKSCGGGYTFELYQYSDVPITFDIFEVISPGNVVLCVGNIANLNVFPIGGYPPFTYLWNTGATTQSTTSMPWAGTLLYSCVVTDINGCTKLASIIVTAVPNPSINFIKKDPTCGKNNGSITIINSLPWYQWSNGMTTQTISNLSEGNYPVLVGDWNGCTANVTIILENKIEISSKTETILTCDANNLKPDTTVFSKNGCDSLFIVNKILKNKSFAAKFINTCDANNLKPDTTFLKNNYGCDSLFVTNKILKNKSFAAKFINTCDANNLKPDTIFFKNNYGCDSLFVVNKILKNKSFAAKFINTCDANNLKPDTTFLKNNYGCDSLFVVNKILKKSQPSFKSLFTCKNANVKTDSIAFKNAYGCDSFLIINTLLKQSAINANSMLTNQISCHDKKDGSLSIENLQGGEMPYQFSWNNGVTNPKIDKLSAGTYTITISDAEQCTFTQSFTIKNPDKVVLKIVERKPLCATDNFGEINLVEVSGGTGNFWYLMDKNSPKKVNSLPMKLSNIGIGKHEIQVFDDNKCAANYNFVYSKPSPLGLNLDIQKNLITLGDSTLVTLKTNFAVNKIVWKPSESLSCDTCLTTYAFPKENTTYEITASDSNGCEVNTILALKVKYVKNVYVPNVFNPNGKTNSMFTIHGNPLIVKRIVSFKIFDRWGTLVHENYDFAPNMGSWDGGFRGEPCNPAVFVYYGDIEFYDGTVKRLVGDVTLMR